MVHLNIQKSKRTSPDIYAKDNRNREFCVQSVQFLCMFNPFPPSVPIWHRLVKLSILI